ncbi:dUTP diphosphatase [Teredinibacter sp. KSP-S5-2]|uniref:dUTP diphosphatase n=1 Tax=Teredinibacter sp. KSP-S5-2 TaxID=3034506 RepID=UPI002934968D|nr:dUTP diphosphatase [Teredinibacter sp. KSP-S5-2]WNO10937.1 dUTP diphosphatase [Teredinibacter sp. KSP-S5-2]
MQNQIITMLKLQDSMNTKVHADWREQNFEWYRAIWIESAELLDHYGWKWWKKQIPDTEQVILELIDIWHFGLSALIMEGADHNTIASEIELKLKTAEKGSDFRADLEDFTLSTLSSKSFHVDKFAKLMADMDLSFEQLFKSYVGKNVLNFFRQDHGYQDGSYLKQWSGREDNEHLVDILSQLDSSADDFQQQLYSALEARYPG